MHGDSLLNELIPRANRKENIAKMSAQMGVPLDILRPNAILNGTFILIFFSCIPMGIGLSCFAAAIRPQPATMQRPVWRCCGRRQGLTRLGVGECT